MYDIPSCRAGTVKQITSTHCSSVMSSCTVTRRVEDLGEGPVDCPTAEQRHATPYWLAARYCDNTTLHGLKNVWAAGSRKRRFLWILCMLLAFTGFGYQVYGTLAEYLEYPKKVTIEVSSHCVRRCYTEFCWNITQKLDSLVSMLLCMLTLLFESAQAGFYLSAFVIFSYYSKLMTTAYKEKSQIKYVRNKVAPCKNKWELHMVSMPCQFPHEYSAPH